MSHLKPASSSSNDLKLEMKNSKASTKWQKYLQLRNLNPKTRGTLIWNIIYMIGGLSFWKLGHWAADVLEVVQGPGNWKTWDFLGNSGRSPMFMHRVYPWVYDILGRRDHERISRL